MSASTSPVAYQPVDSTPEALAALVPSSDPCVDALLHRAEELLKAAGLSPTWAGYRQETNAIINSLHALWNALTGCRLSYAPPTSAGQALRSPTDVLHLGAGSLQDITLLLTAAVAQVGLNPVVILLPDKTNTLLGVWLRDEVLQQAVVKEVATIRNLVKLEDLLLIDPALIYNTGKSVSTFAQARQDADTKLEAVETSTDFAAIDIVRAWSAGFQPGTQPTPETTVEVPSAEPPEGDAHYLPETGAAELEAMSSLVTEKKRTRMERWQLKLLDLSLRNNLLASRIDASQVALLLPDVAQFEDALAEGEKFRVHLLPESVSRDHDKQIKLMLAKGELAADNSGKLTTEAQLQRRLQQLYLANRHGLDESGCNTLYIACGFLKWTRAGAARPLLAPILLIPIALTRKSVKDGFVLRGIDEETRFNLTLLELLKTEYGIRIPKLEGELPTDDAGADVPLIFKSVREAIRGQEGWEVVETCSIGIFSFAKHLMWQDMVERRDALLRNPVVRHLADEERSTYPAQVDFPAPETLDADVDAMRVFTPLSSDSSQLSAIIAAGRCKSFVLIGPPGTGKSQTIANMIAHCLGQGKTVLFVAEKAAALSVVYSRLKRIGLQDFCLELHSNKANRREMLSQFQATLERAAGKTTANDWELAVQEMERLRAQLNQLPHDLHSPFPDGMSLYDDICLIASASSVPELRFSTTTDPATTTAGQKERILESARILGLRYSAVSELFSQRSSPSAPPLGDTVITSTYSAQWEANFADKLTAFDAAAQERDVAYAKLLDAVGDEGARQAPAAELLPLLEIMRTLHGEDGTALLPASASTTLATLDQLFHLAERFRALKASLTLAYPDDAPESPQIPQLWQQWKEAQFSNFISRFFATKRIVKALRMLAFSHNKPDCAHDLQTLLDMRDIRLQAAELMAKASSLPHFFKGLDTTKEDVDQAHAIADRLKPLAHRSDLAIRLLSPGSNPMATASPADLAWQALQACDERIAPITSALQQLVGKELDPACATEPGAGHAWASNLLKEKSLWRELVLWNAEVSSASQAGFTPMVQALKSCRVTPDGLREAVRVNFSRQRLIQVVNNSPELTGFTPALHEDTIREFGKRDSALLKLAGARVATLMDERSKGVYAREYSKELALLQHEIGKQRAHIPPRKLLSGIPHVAPLLKPCMLMSPLSVAQYLTPEAEPYDIVIFDEASQIPVWDAIGALARGKNCVIVGDPRQMPPTSFFGRSGSSNEEEDGVAQDSESILDECIICGIPKMNLAWHYRSKAESLIAYSNYHYYEGKLVTFPAPCTNDSALQYHYVEDGIYRRGADKRNNLAEARALVAHVLSVLRQPDFVYTEATSIGIVTFNIQQQRLIEDLLEDARAKDDSLDLFFAEDNPEAVFVKNLENVQGDERGVIYFSTTFGPDEKGVVSMNFGPLNLTGGERRLNVAITRARTGMHVFTSLRPEDINLNRTKARGVADLRGFLECARMGTSAYFSGRGAKASSDAGLVEMLASALAERGWNCRRHVGVSGFRVDLAVECPDDPTTLLCGILLDGPSYAQAATARDRDVLRESVLHMMGWRLIHLWSLVFWRNPQACIASLLKQLEEMKKSGPPAVAKMPALVSKVCGDSGVLSGSPDRRNAACDAG